MNANDHRPNGLQLGLVTDNGDPDGRGRVQVRLVATDLVVWCPVLTPSAGDGYGVACLPRLDELVVVGFLGPDQPVVLGALWAGAGQAPDDASPVEDNYLIRTPGGSRIRIDDSAPSVQIETPAGHRIAIDEGAGELVIERDGDRIRLSAGGIEVRSASQVQVDAGNVNVSASFVQVDCPMVRFSGVVSCDTLMSNSVVSASYSPGAGNIW